MASLTEEYSTQAYNIYLVVWGYFSPLVTPQYFPELFVSTFLTSFSAKEIKVVKG